MEDEYRSREIVEGFMRENGIQGVLLYSSIAGDVEYNLAAEGDKLEYYGVWAQPTDTVLGLSPPSDTIISTTSSGQAIQLDEIKKWCKMVSKGSPKAIETMYSLPRYCYMTPEWKSFVPVKRKSLLARIGAIHYAGFAKSHVFVNPKKKVRTGPEILKMYQILRLIFVATWMLRGEDPQIYLEDSSTDRQILLDLKCTKDKQAEEGALKTAKEMLSYFDKNINTSVLPERVPIDELDDWLYSLRTRFWNTPPS